MPQRILGTLLLLLALPAVQSTAQRSASTNLTVRVTPEARLEPQQVALRFLVSADGKTDAVAQSGTVKAWVRALPGQRIGVTAHLTGLEGPNGPISETAVAWTSSVANATPGAQQAVGSKGSFGRGAFQELVEGWERSGILTCSVNFELLGARSLPPGVYSGVVDFAVSAH